MARPCQRRSARTPRARHGRGPSRPAGHRPSPDRPPRPRPRTLSSTGSRLMSRRGHRARPSVGRARRRARGRARRRTGRQLLHAGDVEVGDVVGRRQRPSAGVPGRVVQHHLEQHLRAGVAGYPAGRGRSFHMAITRLGGIPRGCERVAMPSAVRVSTADPGPSARAAAYRAVHREASCGPSSSRVSTSVGPIERSSSATPVQPGQVLADHRSDGHAATQVEHVHGPLRDVHASHQRTFGCSAPAML